MSDDPYYVSNDLTSVLEYLKRNTSPSEVVLASYKSSRLIPGLAGNTVVWGHWAQTVDLKAQIARLGPVLSLNSGLDDAARAAGFWGDGVRYAVIDPWLLEQLGGRMPPWLSSSGQVVFQHGDLIVLRHADAGPGTGGPGGSGGGGQGLK